MGRAIVSFFKANFDDYITYNVMAIPVAVVFMIELFNKYFGRYKKIIHVCSASMLIVNLTYYLFRIIYVF